MNFKISSLFLSLGLLFPYIGAHAASVISISSTEVFYPDGVSITNLVTDPDSDRYGSSVAEIGDVDGNGVSDIAVGAMRYHDGTQYLGVVYLHFIDTDGSVMSTAQIHGPTPMRGSSDTYVYFGSSIEPLGDIDGDNIPDIAVGSYHEDYSLADQNTGALNVIRLNSDGSIKGNYHVESAEPLSASGNFVTLTDNAYFGSSIAYLGDIDGVSGSDFALAVGAFGMYAGSSSLAGRVYILLFSEQSEADPLLDSYSIVSNSDLVASLETNDRLGISIDSWDDVNGNGVPEVLVGTVNDDGDNTNTAYGAVYLLYPDTDGSLLEYKKIGHGGGNLSLDAGERFGQSIANLGDIDGNGVSDIAVGASYYESGKGRIHVLFLESDFTVKESFILDESTSNGSGVLGSNDQYGYSISSSLEDIDGNGFNDLFVGAFDYDGPSNTAERGGVFRHSLNFVFPQVSVSSNKRPSRRYPREHVKSLFEKAGKPAKDRDMTSVFSEVLDLLNLRSQATGATIEGTTLGNIATCDLITEELSYGMADIHRGVSQVKRLQQRINAMGYGPVDIDGIFQDSTSKAIKKIQTDNGMFPDGIVGPGTQNILNIICR